MLGDFGDPDLHDSRNLEEKREEKEDYVNIDIRQNGLVETAAPAAEALVAVSKTSSQSRCLKNFDPTKNIYESCKVTMCAGGVKGRG